MALYALGDLAPQIHELAFVHPDAVVIGDVRVGAEASLWPGAVARGDSGFIEIGEGTSIQDGTVLHTTPSFPTRIGRGCVIGHNAHLEGCRIGDGCLIGSGSVVLNRAEVEPGAAVAAGAVVAEGKVVPTGHLALGVPARTRPTPEIPNWVENAVRHYTRLASRYRVELRRLD